MKRNLLIISGPTASGKTALALKLAMEFDGELISADSRQVYKGMDVVTGKDLPVNSKLQISNYKLNKVSFRTDAKQSDTEPYEGKYRFPMMVDSQLENDTTRGFRNKFEMTGAIGFYEVEGVKVWGLDFVEPNQDFDVSHFINFSHVILNDIWRKRKLPIIVGGTGFWIRSLISPPDTVGVSINKKLRQELDELSVTDLQVRLKEIDSNKFEKMNNSDRNNPRRLVRAIEVGEHKMSNVKCQRLKKQNIYSVSFCADTKLSDTKSYDKVPKDSKSCLQPVWNDKKRSTDIINRFPTVADNQFGNDIALLYIGLKMDQESLRKKIEKRVKERVKNGAIEETKKLASKYSWDLPSMSGIGYRDLREFLEGKMSKEEAIENWILHETQYAKRQMTFLSKIKDIEWFAVQDNNFFARIKSKVINFLQ